MASSYRKATQCLMLALTLGCLHFSYVSCVRTMPTSMPLNLCGCISYLRRRPNPKGSGYRNKARLRGLNYKTEMLPPMPATFEVLQRNVQRLNLEKIKLFTCGLSQHSQTMTFAYYPNSTGWSTIYPDDSKEQRDLIKKVALNNLNIISTRPRDPFVGFVGFLPSCDRLLSKTN